MTANRAVVAAISLAATVLSLRAQAQDPYQDLRKYDFQDRRAAMAIRRDIQAAGQDRARQAAIENGLIGVIQDAASTLAAKQEAARLLWFVAGAKSAPVLARLLPDPAMNDIARYALERDPDPAAGAALRAGLSASKGAPLVGVINSVGNRADAAAVPDLRRLAASSDRLVSDASITALGKIGTAGAVAALRSLPSKGLNVFNALLRSAGRLTSQRGPASAEGLRLYVDLTGPAYPSVIRAGALAGLAGLNAPQTSTIALSVAQTGTDATLQRVAGSIAGRLENPADTRRAIISYPKLPPVAQVALLTAWSDRRELSTAATVASGLKSESAEVRAAAVRALANVGGSGNVPALAELAAGGDEAQVARESLARMKGTGVEQSLISLLNAGRPEVRVAAVNILAERPGPTSETALLNAASGSDSRVASAALKALGRVGAPAQQSKLVAILVETRDEGVRDAAQSAIVAIAQRSGDRSAAAAPLLSSYGSASPAGKMALITALSEVGGDRALEVITRETSSADAEIRGAALNALATSWSDPRPMDTLRKLSRDGASRSEKIVALRGFIRLVGLDDLEPASNRVARIREAMALADRPEEKRQALSVLREIRSPAAVDVAAASLDDPQLVNEAADAILYLASKQRKNNRDIPAVTGPAVQAALDKVIRTVKDDNIRSRAEKMRQG